MSCAGEKGSVIVEFSREVSAIPDLKLSDDALGEARARLAEAAMPVIGAPGPGVGVFASEIVAGALGEIEPVLERARTGLAIVVGGISADVGAAAAEFTAVDAQLAGGVQ